MPEDEDTSEDDYEDDEFEEDENEPEPQPAAPITRPAPAKQPVPESVSSTGRVRGGAAAETPAPPTHKAPWSLITLRELELGEKLAAGAFSRVHAGRWQGRDVAVKVLTDTSAAQLRACEEELLVHAALTTHAGVVRLHGANLSLPDCCIVMERCRGSIFERLHRQHDADLDRRDAVDMAAQVAEAMAFLHAQQPPVVHRDLKSHNVLIDADGRCRLCDFGLVGTRAVTAGTPNYMAPELFLAKAYSTPVDVFAFGVLLNELFTREVPWDGYQPLDIKDKVVEGERPRTAKTMPHACEGLLRKLWHQHASLRPSFKEALPRLRSIEESLPLGSKMLEAKYGCGSSLGGAGGAGGGRGGRGGLGGGKFVDALDDFAMLGLNKTV